jgi:hypothetical protein
MDFGNGQSALTDALSAAQATASQLAGRCGISTAPAYARMGLTPIAGQNDDNEFFSQANASSLESFAASNGVQELSFWEVDGYDKPDGYAYSKIFNAITSGAGPGRGAPAGAGPDHRLRGLVRRRAQRLDRELHARPGLHLQRDRRPAVDRRRRPDPTQLQIWSCSGNANQDWVIAG